MEPPEGTQEAKTGAPDYYHVLGVAPTADAAAIDAAFQGRSLRFRVGAKDLAIEPTLNLLQDRAPAKRKAAAQALAKTFKANERTFALVTNTLAKDKEISDRWRGFNDVAASRHLANRVEPEVVDALVSSVREAYPRLSHRYYKLKAKWFGKKTLAHWNRNAPLPQVPLRTIKWPEAADTVLSAYGAFSPKMASIACC